jgi:hypothetical protein
MAKTRFPSADRAGAGRRGRSSPPLAANPGAYRRLPAGLGALVVLLALTGAAPLRDAPVVWYADDARTVPEPWEREPNLLWDGVQASFVRPVARVTHPGRFVRRIGVLFGGDHVPPAANVNRLDEVPNSSWFTNRIGLFPVSPEAAARGPEGGVGPDRSAPWTVVGAKTEGVTPGFRIRDARGDLYLIKFDPPEFPGMSSAAAVISGKILYAAGYNVPEDDIATFTRDDLVLGDGVTLTLPDGTKRPMTGADVDTILARVASPGSPAIRAIASKFLSGTPVGPFDWRGRRKDDPNDRVNHEDRRELRGLRMIAAWINHFDTKQHNTLDMFVEEGGRRFVRHHLIDFASTLGVGAGGPKPSFGFEHSMDFPPIGGRLLALGFHQDAWRRLPGLEPGSEIGYFESTEFDPIEWKPLVPNAAFANLTDGDGYWAAKIISAFTDAHLQALVASGRYRQPESAATMARILGERRDRIARTWFDRVPPLDFFRLQGTALRFRDLGTERGIYPEAATRIRGRVAVVDAGRRGGWSDWKAVAGHTFDAHGGVFAFPVGDQGVGAHPFFAFELQVDRGRGWSGSVRVYVARESGRVVGVER